MEISAKSLPSFSRILASMIELGYCVSGAIRFSHSRLMFFSKDFLLVSERIDRSMIRDIEIRIDQKYYCLIKFVQFVYSSCFNNLFT